MSYIQTSYKGPGIWVGVVVALVLLSRCAVGLSVPSTGSADGAERALFANAETAEIYRTMKRTHPKVFAALTERIASLSKAGRSHAEIEAAIAKFMAVEEGKLFPDMMQSGSTAMGEFRRAEVGVMRALQAADPRLCAAYVINGSLQLPEGTARTAQPAIVALHIATWNAAADGRDHPAGRKLGQPKDADWAIIDKAMLADGVPEATLRTFFDPARAVLLPVEAQCSTGLSFRSAIDSLPAPRADDFFAALMHAV